MMANPSVLGAVPSPAQHYEAEIRRLELADPPAQSLGNEMVMLAAGPIGRGLPFAIRAGAKGAASIRALSGQAEQAANAIVQSFRNRLGRPPTARELVEALGPIRHVTGRWNGDEGSGDNPTNAEGYNPGSIPGNVRWNARGSGEAAFDEPSPWPRPNYDAVEHGTPLFDILRQVAIEAQDKLGQANDQIRGLGGRSFQTYTKRNLDAPRRYVGRTSGFEEPDENVRLRYMDGYPSTNYGPARLDRSSDYYSAIRGREHGMIVRDKEAGISDNKNNGISPLNPLKGYYLRMAEDEFGRLPSIRRK